MKTSDIKYNLSTDYDRLEKLLKKGCVVAGIKRSVYDNESEDPDMYIHFFDYDKTHKFYCLGFTLFERDAEKHGFADICKKYGIRYFDIDCEIDK